jgi:hypothetical protein
MWKMIVATYQILRMYEKYKTLIITHFKKIEILNVN